MHWTLVLLAVLAATGQELSNPKNYPPNCRVRDGEEFDFIVVGAGSAGSVVARRLAEVEKWSVLLIEAGHDPLADSDVPFFYSRLPFTEMDWAFKTVPQKHGCQGMNNKQCSYNQGKCLGGTSSLNLMLYIRGNRDDFDEWERMGNPGWGYSDVLKYFKKSENQTDPDLPSEFHGRNGPLGVSLFGEDRRLNDLRDALFEGTRELGYPTLKEVNGKTQVGFSPVYGVVREGERQSTGKVFLGQGKFQNLKVSRDSLVHRVIIEKGKATGVEFVRDGKKVRVRARKEVVVSAGAINSPQILMLSGLGPEKHLKEVGVEVVKNIPGVGLNFHDHFLFPGAFFRSKPMFRCFDGESAQKEYSATRMGPFSGISMIGQYVGFLDTLEGSEIPDNQLTALAACVNETSNLVSFLTSANVRQSIGDLYSKAYEGYDGVLLPSYILKPFSRGTIRLRSKDPNDTPLIDPNLLSDPRDIATLIRGFRVAMNVAKTEALKPYDLEFVDVDVPECRGLASGSDERLACLIKLLPISVYHYAGSCKMGPKRDREAVVDARLRVRGVKGLRVIDNSIMPKVSRGNTNAPAIMIGEKGADMIKQDWKQPTDTC